ncbi:MAG: PKD domain-containing protein [Bacteroidetes bacterium]|nr:PKD domain-containing protein [Bacteroidota bacterium]
MQLGSSSTNSVCNSANGNATITPTGATSPYTFIWDDPSSQTTATATGLFGGPYNVTVTDNNNCIQLATVGISDVADPTATFDSTMVSCFGGNDGTASVVVTGTAPPFNYLWNDSAAQTTAMATGLPAGNFNITVIDANGCVISKTITVDQVADYITSVVVSHLKCFNDNNGSIAVTSSGGTPPFSYLWNDPGSQTLASASALATGNYTLQVTDANNCVYIVNDNVTQPDLMVGTASANDTICIGGSTTISVSMVGGNGGYIYSWDQGIGNSSSASVSPTVPTTYNATTTDSLNCTSNAISISVYVRDLTVDNVSTSSTGPICEGGSATIVATHNGPLGPYTYVWNNGLANGLGPYTVSPDSSATYTITVSDLCSNTITSAITLDVTDMPDILLPYLIQDGCAPVTVNFVDTAGNPPGYSYSWDFGDGSISNNASPTHSYTIVGAYNVSLVITSPDNCINSSSADSGVVVVNRSSVADFTVNPTTTDIRKPIFNFTNQSSPDAIQPQWDFGDGDTSISLNPIHTYGDTGTYAVTLDVTNSFGCPDKYTLYVVVEPYHEILIPDAFTPNPAGPNGGDYSINPFANHVFYPITQYVAEYRFEVFNRWGELVFVSEDINIGWDGYYRNTLSQQDVYVYRVWLKYTDGIEKILAGDVTLLR